jgi:hypothetical protein
MPSKFSHTAGASDGHIVEAANGLEKILRIENGELSRTEGQST